MLPTGLFPMLATTGELPRSDAWAYEVKWDGVRTLVAVERGRVRATSRNGNDITGGYPELQTLTGGPVLLDGEIVAFVDGVPDFGALQSRMHVQSPTAALIERVPVCFLPFDVLHLGDHSLLDLPYDDRRELLEKLDLGVQVPPAFHGDGQDVLNSTLAQGLEGVVAKRRDSRYTPGRRSDCWLKVKHVRRQSAVVCGWKGGDEGRSAHLGSLLLGVHEPTGLVYAGHVGTGFTAAARRMLEERLLPLARPASPYTGKVPPEHVRTAHWVSAEVVVDVEFTIWTRDGRLRQPSYKGMRDDLDPATVVREP